MVDQDKEGKCYSPVLGPSAQNNWGQPKPEKPPVKYNYVDREDLETEIEDWWEYSHAPLLNDAHQYYRKLIECCTFLHQSQ